MATKKQKRLAGEQKQAINRAESIRSGLAAQKKSRQVEEARFKSRAKAFEAKERKEKALKKNTDGVKKATAAMAGVGAAAKTAQESFDVLYDAMEEAQIEDYMLETDDTFGPVETIDLKRIS